jgi:serine/threonine protein kinase
VIITDHPSRLILIDFGSAWTTDRTASREDGDGMNPLYAAPELQTKEATPVGFFADQFSVSVLFYELLTQELPYGKLGGKAGRPESISRARDALVPPSHISRVCRGLPRPLRDGIDRLAMRGLALEAADRYPDRHAWLDDLFEVYARFRLPAELSPAQALLTRVIGWFVKPGGPQ